MAYDTTGAVDEKKPVMESPYQAGNRSEYNYGLMGRMDSEGNNQRGLASPSPTTSPSSSIGLNGQSNAGPAGLDLTGWNNKMSPELQSIIDKVTASSTGPAKRNALVNLAGTIGGIQSHREAEIGQMKQLGITGSQAMERTKLSETGAMERTKLQLIPSMMEQKRKDLPYPGGIGTTPTTVPSTGNKNWWDTDEHLSNPLIYH